MVHFQIAASPRKKFFFSEKIHLQLKCNNASYNYTFHSHESKNFSVVPTNSCLLSAKSICVYPPLIEIQEEESNLIINNSGRMSFFNNRVVVQWFDDKYYRMLQKLSIKEIECLHKIYSPFFKDKIKLEICADNTLCTKFYFAFSKPQTFNISYNISFKHLLVIKLWYLEYGLESSCSLIDSMSFLESRELGETLSFIHGNGHYKIHLDL